MNSFNYSSCFKKQTTQFRVTDSPAQVPVRLNRGSEAAVPGRLRFHSCHLVQVLLWFMRLYLFKPLYFRFDVQVTRIINSYNPWAYYLLLCSSSMELLQSNGQSVLTRDFEM